VVKDSKSAVIFGEKYDSVINFKKIEKILKIEKKLYICYFTYRLIICQISLMFDSLSKTINLELLQILVKNR
jgi:hypothetical protein